MLCHLLTKLELTASASMAQRLTDDCVFQWVNGVPLSLICFNSRTALHCICKLLGYLRSQSFYVCRLCGMTASSVSLFTLHSLCYFDVAAGIDTTVTKRKQPNYCLPSIRESYWISGGCANTSKKVFLLDA